MLNKYKRRVKFGIYNIHGRLENPVEEVTPKHTHTHAHILVLVLLWTLLAQFPWSPCLKTSWTGATRLLFTHTPTSTQLQPRGAKRQLSYYFSQYAGSFRVSLIHRTTGLQDLYRAYVIINLMRAYTHGGWEQRQQVSTTLFTPRNKFFLCSWRDSNLRPLHDTYIHTVNS